MKLPTVGRTRLPRGAIARSRMRYAWVLATVLAILAAGFRILPPAGQYSIHSPGDRLGLAIFGLMGIAVSVIAELCKRACGKGSSHDQGLALRETLQ